MLSCAHSACAVYLCVSGYKKMSVRALLNTLSLCLSLSVPYSLSSQAHCLILCLCRRGKVQIIQQMAERQEERLLNEEFKEQEGQQVLDKLEQLQVEEMEVAVLPGRACALVE